jgi:hypothetical protein
MLNSTYRVLQGIVREKTELGRLKSAGADEQLVWGQAVKVFDAATKAVVPIRHFQYFLEEFHAVLQKVLTFLEEIFGISGIAAKGSDVWSEAARRASPLAFGSTLVPPDVQTLKQQPDDEDIKLEIISKNKGWAAAALKYLQLCSEHQTSLYELALLPQTKEEHSVFPLISVSTITIPPKEKDNATLPMAEFLFGFIPDAEKRTKIVECIEGFDAARTDIPHCKNFWLNSYTINSRFMVSKPCCPACEVLQKPPKGGRTLWKAVSLPPWLPRKFSQPLIDLAESTLRERLEGLIQDKMKREREEEKSEVHNSEEGGSG